MSDIRQGLQGISEPDKSIGLLLIEFYEQMKTLEKDPQRGGKQATAIVMAINDINSAHRANVLRWIDDKLSEPSSAYPPVFATFMAVKAHIEG